MEVHDLIERGYKCKECHFFATTDEDIKEHISSSHFWLLAKKQKLSDPVSFQDPSTVKTWKNIFQVTAHDVTKAILGSLDNETFLACRLVCQGWRSAVNRYKPKWKEIKGASFGDALSDAIKGGQTLVAEMLISNVVNFKVTEYDFGEECEPIHIAARVGNISMLEMLITNGANVNPKDWDGRTPLSIAVEGDSSPVVDMLIANGADVNSRDDEDDETPLQRASRGKNAAIVESLLLNGADANPTNEYKESPLHFASKNGDASIVEVLVKNGADVDAKDSDEDTALHIAARGNFESVVEILVSNGADVEIKNEDDETPLAIATEQNYPEVVKSLLKHGKHGANQLQRALYDAVRECHSEVVDVLLSNGVDPNVPKIQEGSFSPIKFAAYKDRWDIVSSMLKHGANPDIDIFNGITVLQRAVFYDDLPGVELLFSHGASLNIQGKNGFSALHFVRSAEMAEWLCDHGSDLNIRNMDNETPLQMFERDGREEIANKLKSYLAERTDMKLKCD